MKLLRKRTKKPADKMTYMRTSEIKLHDDLKSLFPINKTVRDSIAASIRKNGFDENHPLIMWKEENVLVDGHTRLAACKIIGLKQIYVVFKSFSDLDAAIEYARQLQFHRRNLTDPDLFAYVLRLDVDNLSGIGRKQERLARLCNISTTRAVRFIKVKKDGTRKQHSEILAGKQTVNAVYDILSRKRVHVVSPDSKRSTGRMVKIPADDFSRLLGDWMRRNPDYSPVSSTDCEILNLISLVCLDPDQKEALVRIIGE